MLESRRRDTIGAGAWSMLLVVDGARDARFALVRCSSSNTFGPLPATGYEPLTGGSDAIALS
jgi:hypothetical protein